MGAITTLKQNNKPWTLTWKASGRYPIVADRIFATLADAQAYVDDTSATASATGGLVLSVISDSVAKNNGVYYVKSVANTDPKYGALLDKGTLVKVGGSEIEFADTYSEAVELSNTLVVGQMIKVANVETVGENTFKAGFYIVETPGTISALDTSTGSSDEIGAIKSRVDALEGNRVLTSDFDTYKGEVTTALDGKVDDSEFTTYQGTISTALDSKVDDSEFATYKSDVESALGGKVASGDFDTYKGEVTTALGGKVASDDFDTYKGEVTAALSEKATTTDLTNLETKVDGDIKVLTDLIDDYSGTLGDVDDRLGELEAFVEAHESIDIPSIEALFAESEE